MTEWRRTLESWPKETPQTADPASLPIWAVEAGRERSEASGAKRTTRRLKIFFLFGVVPYVLLAAILPSSPLSWGMLASAFVVGAVSLALALHAQRRMAVSRRDASLDRAALVGEPTLDAEYVGVDYTDAAWLYPGLGTSADEGFLRLEMDRLVFVGRDTRFELPADAILGTELRLHDPGLGLNPRLVLRWAHGGEAGTVGLHLPLGRSTRQRVQDASDLRDRVERWRGKPFPRRCAPASLPPTKKANPYLQVGLLAKGLAAATLFATFIGLFSLVEFALLWTGHRDWARHIGGQTFVLYVPALTIWIALAAKIESHLPERYRYRESDDVREALRNADTRFESKPTSDEIKAR